MNRKVAVIIPFYQRQRGILRGALDSVASQQLGSDVKLKIVIVDDESPLPLEQALEGFAGGKNLEVVFLKQKNGGPGSARNLALNSLDPAEVDFVAFLDSDDRWHPTHVSDALAALGSDFGFYFSNHTRFDLEGDWFTSQEVLHSWTDPHSTEGKTPVADAERPHLVEFERSYLLTCMIRTYVCQTSTVVYRLRDNEQLRFDASLRGAGEDQLAFLQLASSNRSIVSTRPTVHCDKGVNMFCGAFSWENARSADRYGHMVIFLGELTKQRFLSRSDLQSIRRDRRKFCRAYSYLFFRAVARRSAPSLSVLAEIVRRSPQTAVMMPFRFLSVIPNRAAEARSW